MKTIALILLIAATALTSCTDSNDDSTMSMFRARTLSTGTILPVTVSHDQDIYKVGDTVWVNKNRQIIPIELNTKENNCGGLDRVVIEITADSEL